MLKLPKDGHLQSLLGSSEMSTSAAVVFALLILVILGAVSVNFFRPLLTTS